MSGMKVELDKLKSKNEKLTKEDERLLEAKSQELLHNELALAEDERMFRSQPRASQMLHYAICHPQSQQLPPPKLPELPQRLPQPQPQG